MHGTNGLVFGLALVLTGVGTALLLLRAGPVPFDFFWTFNTQDEWKRQLVIWEYERVDGLAKGLASAAVGFLGSLALAAVKGEIDAGISTLDVVGCYLGVVGCLAAAALLQADARAFARHPKVKAWRGSI